MVFWCVCVWVGVGGAEIVSLTCKGASRKKDWEPPKPANKSQLKGITET